VLQPAKCLAVDDAVAVTLKRRTDVVFRFSTQAAARFGALGGLWRENVVLARFELLTKSGHTFEREARKGRKANQIILCGLSGLRVPLW
jgi:hypothetical protein